MGNRFFRIEIPRYGRVRAMNLLGMFHLISEIGKLSTFDVMPIDPGREHVRNYVILDIALSSTGYVFM